MPRTWNGDQYQERIDALAAEGEDVHGEADFVMQLAPRSVLDAGCGTGRVAIELAARGCEVTGVDVDQSMLTTARRRSDTVTWIEADVCDLDLGRSFDVVVMSGNVPLFTPPGTVDELIEGAARHLAPTGALVAGFSTDWSDRPYSYEQHEGACRSAGLAVVERFSTWDRDPWRSDAGYTVCIARMA